jgi:hypothetical protein
MDSQPLYLSALIVGGQKHNVLYVVTEHDSVFAFDADTGSQLWMVLVLGAGAQRRSRLHPEIIDPIAEAHRQIQGSKIRQQPAL